MIEQALYKLLTTDADVDRGFLQSALSQAIDPCRVVGVRERQSADSGQ